MAVAPATRQHERRGPANAGETFDDFYREYAPRVAGLVRRRVDESHHVEDIVQETLLRAFRNGLHHSGEQDPWPWLATVARNLCADMWRRRSAHPEAPLDTAPQIPAGRTADPHHQLDRALDAAHVRTILSGVTPRHRRVLTSHHLDGRACEDIASAEGISVDAVKSTLVRARRAFRNLYETPELRRRLAVSLGVLRPAADALRRLRVGAGHAVRSPAVRNPAATVAAAPPLAKLAAAAVAIGVLAAPGTDVGSSDGAGRIPGQVPTAVERSTSSTLSGADRELPTARSSHDTGGPAGAASTESDAGLTGRERSAPVGADTSPDPGSVTDEGSATVNNDVDGAVSDPAGSLVETTDDTLEGTVDDATGTIDDTTDTLEGTVDDTTGTIDETLDDTTGTLDDTVDSVEDTADDLVSDTESTVTTVTTTLTVPSL